MKKSLLTIIISLCLISIALVFPLSKSAERYIIDTFNSESFSVNGKVSKTQLTPGDTFSISLGLKDINGFQTGVNAYCATIEYDEALFETVKQSDFSSLGNWVGFEYNPSNNMLIAYTNSRIQDNCDVLKLNLKVKNDAEDATTSIRFKDFTVSEGTSDIVSDYETEVEIKKALPPPQEPEGDTYYYIEGANLEYVIGSSELATFRINAEYSLFENGGQVFVDDVLVDKENYNSKSGSTIVELKKSYIETLKPGKHTLNVILSNSNSVKTFFYIKEKEEVSPIQNGNITTNGGSVNNNPSNKVQPATSIQNILSTANNSNVKSDIKTNINSNGNENSVEEPENSEPVSKDQKKSKDVSNRKYLYIGIAFIILLLLLIIFFIIKRRKKDSSVGGGTLLLIFATLVAIGVGYNVHAFTLKGEVNGDNVVNETDINIIKRYIVELGTIADEYLQNADMNNDEQITVTDLSLVITEAGKTPVTSTVEVVSSSSSKVLVGKNESVEITYKLMTDVNSIQALIIDDEEIPVSTDGEESGSGNKDQGIHEETVTVTVQGINKAGQHNYVLRGVKIGQATIDVNYETSVYVKKDKPSILVTGITDSKDSNEVAFKFEISDEDESFVNGAISLYASDDTTFATPLISEAITGVDIKEVVLTLEENKEYVYRIEASYEQDPREEGQRGDGTSGVEVYTGTYTLVKDDGFEVTGVKLVNVDNSEIDYNEKNTTTRVLLEVSNTGSLDATYIIINGEKRSLTKSGNNYYVDITESESGQKSYTISGVLLSNLKEIIFADPIIKNIEILKDAPEVSELDIDSKKLTMTVGFNAKDTDSTITSGKIEIIDKGNSSSIEDKPIDVDESNSFKFSLEGNKDYTVRVTIEYARDEAGVAYTDTIVREKDYRLDVKPSCVELKDVYNVTLYRSTSSGLVKDESINKNSLPSDLSDLYVKIDMKSLPTYYAGVERLDVKDNKLYAVLDETEFLQYRLVDGKYEESEEVSFEISYSDNGSIQGGRGSAKEFFESITDLNGTYNLTRDLDATDIKTALPLINDKFTGTLNGNGYTIYNLNTALFKELDGAIVKNINFENSKFTREGDNKGLLATRANKATITNVKANRIIADTKSSEAGGLIGVMTGGSNMSEVFMENVLFTGNNTRTGGMVGAISGGSSINNCVIEGYINATSSEVGAIVGWGQSSTLSGVVFKGEINSLNKNRVGGIIGYGSGNTRIDNSITVANGSNAYAVYGASIKPTTGAAPSGGMYVIDSTNLEYHDDIEGLYDLEFLTQDWFLTLYVGFEDDLVPKVMDIMQRDLQEVKLDETILNYEVLSHLEGYNQSNENLYINLSKLMPFADTMDWIDSAKSINDVNLKNKKIKNIIPFKGSAQIVALNKSGVSDINSIKVTFDDYTTADYGVSYSNTADGVIAEYTISGLGVKYQYPSYLNVLDSGLIKEISSALKGYDYDTNLRVDSKENRIYRDYYNEQVKPALDDFARDYISAQSKYPTYLVDSTISKNIKEDLITKGELKKIIFAYNYYSKWYNLEMGSSNVSDTLFFNSNLSLGLPVEEMVEKALNGNRSTDSTQGFYNSQIRGFTEKKLPEYLEYLLSLYSDEKDPNNWFANRFEGILVETKGLGATDPDQLVYRIWDNLKKTRENLLLPLLTAPTKEMYLSSMPTTIIIGSMNKYLEDSLDTKAREDFRKSVTDYSFNFAHVYGVSSGIITRGLEIVNTGYTQMHFDTRLGFASTKYHGTQTNATTEDPTLKWVYSAIGIEVATNGAQAYGYGGDVLWEITPAIGSVYVASHESSHTQYRQYWYNGNGGRPGTGFEANADGALSQQTGDGGLVFNLWQNLDRESDVTNNYTYERINSAQKAWDFYDNLFDSSYVLDYLAAQAFLSLDPAVQAKVAVRANEEHSGNLMSTSYERVSEADIRAMNLNSISDLIRNKIMVRNTGKVSVANDGTYGTESLWVFNWYQPHNDSGSPDDNTFKKLGWEMFGYKGYEGFVTYRSNLSSTDLDAIQKITGDPEMTWDKYKNMRFNEVEADIDKVKYFDKDEVIEQFKYAFEDDAKTGEFNKSANVKRIYHQILKKKTNDYTTGKVYEGNVVEINSAQQLVNAIRGDMYGVFSIKQPLDFSSVEKSGQGNYYIEKFVGTIIGNGQSITGLKATLFKDAKFATISNLIIDGSGYDKETKAIIALNSNNVILYDITVNDVKLSSVFSRTTGGAYMEYECSIGTSLVPISNASELLSLYSAENGLQKSYYLTGDIDLTSEAVGRTYIIPGTFSGTFDGRNHKIIGLHNTLFEKTEKATVKNLVIENAAITGQSVVARDVTLETIFSGVAVLTPSLAANSNDTGIFAGSMSGKSIIEMSAVVGFTITGDRSSVGGMVGSINGGCTIRDCYVEGVLQNTGGSTGGVVGYGNGDSMIRDSIVSVKLVDTSAYSGGILGQIYWAQSGQSCFVRNVLSLADGNNGNVIVNNQGSQWKDLRGSSGNNYALSTSALTEYTKATTMVDPTEIDEGFFKNRLGLRADRWDLDNKDLDNLPTLLNLMYSPAPIVLSQSIEDDIDLEEEDNEIISISSVEEFLAINDRPDGEYVLTADIDFSEVSIDTETIITETFSGVLRGDGYTISNISKPLFNVIEDAVVENINIETALIEDDENLGALAKEILNSLIENVFVVKPEIIEDQPLQVNN